MLNRAAIDWQTGTTRERPWETDARPAMRLASMYVAFAAMLALIGARFVWVQTTLTEVYAGEFGQTRVRKTTIPCPDARILTADGQVLADDVPQVGLTVHYRWLEEPANPLWLRQQALSRLDRSDRRQRDKVQAEIDAIVARRDRMWADLSQLTGIEAASLLEARSEIQARVERIRQRAEARRSERQAARQTPTSLETDNPWWKQAWGAVIATLTTPPEREAEQPLVVEEELGYHAIATDIDPAIATRIEARTSQFPGVRIAESSRRVYPHSAIAPHVVGVRKPVDAEFVEQRRRDFPQGDPLDYQVGDRRGLSGLEQQYDSLLRGLRGEVTLTLNRHGEVIETRVARERRPGRDIVLTLDLALQQAAESLLDDALCGAKQDEVTGDALPVPPGGSLIALDVRTGAILACATAPRFDLNVLIEGDPAAWQAVQADPRKPLFDRATRMTLPPGSVFKAVSAAAFLEGGHIDPEATVHCQGYLDRPDQYRCLIFRRFQTGHHDMTLVDALARSCNVYFFTQARHVGPEAIHEWARKFGIGGKTGIDLPGESAGRLPQPRAKRDGRRMGETLQLSIGQAELTVTPLQVARMMAAIANGGRLVTPHLVESTGPAIVRQDEDDAAQIQVPEPAPIPGLSQNTLHWLRLGLQQVVASPQGTGYKTVRLDEVAIAGKTGTAEPGGGRPDHAWFAGYVPADRPRVAFVVVLEHAGSGGHVAGPLARKFVQAMLAQEIVTPQTRQ